MPAAKAHRQSVKRYRRNGSVRTVTRSSITKALRTLEAGGGGSNGIIVFQCTLVVLDAERVEPFDQQVLAAFEEVHGEQFLGDRIGCYPR